jgi:hypothetical protein
VREALVSAPPDFFCGLACRIAGIALGFLLRGQRGIAFGRFSLSERLGFLDLALRLRGEFGVTRRLRGEFSLTRLLRGFALGSADGARLIYGDPFKALLFGSGVLAGGAKFFQHRFFDSGGIVPTFEKVGASEAAHSFSYGDIRGTGYMAFSCGIYNSQ